MQTLAPSDARDRALRMLAEGNEDEFIALASTLLAASPQDDYVRLMLARSYLRLGLVNPAREALADVPNDEPEVAQLSRQLARLPDTRVPWSRFSPVFQRNLEALAGRFDVNPLLASWKERAWQYELYRDRRQQWQVREQNGDGTWAWFPAVGDHAAQDSARPLPEDHRALMPGPYLFEGVGLGGYFERIHSVTRNTFLGFSCALLLVEPRPQRLAAALHLRDWSPILADPRVLLFLGPEGVERLRRAWHNDLNLPLPTSVITTGSTCANARRAVHVVRVAASEREVRVRTSLNDLNRMYAGRDVAFWSSRFNEALRGNGEPLRILAGVSSHTTFLQHSMRDAKRALESLGHRVRVLTEATSYHVVGPLSYHQTIREFRPDLFLALDHFRPEFGPILPANLPVLTWDQDSLPHVLTRANLAGLAAHDFVVGSSKIRCIELGLPANQCLYARVPTCPEQFSAAGALTPEEAASYTCDVSYVSHASQTPEQFHEQERSLCRDPAHARLLDAIYRVLPPLLEKSSVADGFVMQEALDAASRAAGVRVIDEQAKTRLQGWHIWRLADRLFRHEALEWVGAWAARTGRSFRLYGDGWDRHPTLARFAAGRAANGRELLCIYRASKINLQLMPGGFIHQRALDGLAAGGFFLTRRVPGDLLGRTLRALIGRIRELGIVSTEQLLASRDGDLQALVRGYMGRSPEECGTCAADPLLRILVNSELVYPDEIFPDFSSIVFHSPQRFGELADRFLADAEGRRRIADQYRSVVVEHFSYQAAMKQFLHAMTAHLGKVAAVKPSCEIDR